ncbi:nicotinate-nucleotide--dimethylbenzimidazole phosphoribosyltransferase [Effusibacillus dendaii]|uniref:Nicotinate-nucleotide--dimethylbenzimidazole phosphoribosyltransferase n=1 Tax=Effusibacillus dendaii TaxID=2743772 RepID=A0A7I8D911_9BACL|nr:nicotinate-nucleotide--dimethylbenzimidazole phosphoribosyltransferase [Effusibacillus dendaii]BCJ86633.1 nicotinate-nucleotide--dimethylbenzimidazole phosphoribosyltransferase [Effusibacillus dendaii]
MWKLPQPIDDINSQYVQEARARHDQLTKPPGSLGFLEEIGIRLAGIQENILPDVDSAAVVVMAADHGVTEEGVSAFPSEVTVQMVLNFMNGGAAVNALARNAGADVHVVDIGVKSDIPNAAQFTERPGSRLWIDKVRYGTANMAKEPAMTRAEAEEALQVGWRMGETLYNQGYKMVALGEMGIGNTTASAAITSLLANVPVDQITGTGTGLSAAGVRQKVATIQRAIELHNPNSADPIDVLAKVGGLEIAGLAGLTLACAAYRIPVVVDGFITGAAALAAVRMDERVRSYLFASHQSVEPGHQVVLEALGLRPLFDFSMRLGEGSGAALALPVLKAAARVLREMATFAEAGVADGK